MLPLSRAKPLALVLILLVALACASTLTWVEYTRRHRPMFFNTFARHPDRGIIPEWWPFPYPQVDMHGNIILLDKELNLIVIVVTDSPGYVGRRVPEPHDGYALLDLGLTNPVEIRIPRAENKIMIFYADGRPRQEVGLADKSAPDLFDRITSSNMDFIEAIRQSHFDVPTTNRAQGK